MEVGLGHFQERYIVRFHICSEATTTLLLTRRGRRRRRCELRRYLHDEEEEEDDKDADVGVEPGGRAAQARWGRRSRDFGPGEIIKERVDALPGHELHTCILLTESNRQERKKHLIKYELGNITLL